MKVRQKMLEKLSPEVKEIASHAVRIIHRFELTRNKLTTKVSQARIVKDLRNLGIKDGDILFVHSSLRSIGFVEGGADTVIDALLEAIGPSGTLVMPAFSYVNGSMLETLQRGIVFDPQKAPVVVGTIPETFRKRLGVRRSIHPTHSVCALGAKAEWITSGAENAPTNFGPGTPSYKIMEENGFILGLGCHFGHCTYTHVIEDSIDDFPIEVHHPKVFEATVIDNAGRERIMRVKALDPEVSRTRKDTARGEWVRQFLVRYLTAEGFLVTGYVSKSKCWLIRLGDLFEAQKELLKYNITEYTTEQEYLEHPKGIINLIARSSRPKTGERGQR